MESRYDYDIIRDYLHGLVEREKAIEIGNLIRSDEVARDIAEGILRLENDFNENDQDIENYLENFRLTQLKKIQAQTSGKAGSLIKNIWLKVAAVVLIAVAVGFAIQKTFYKPDLIVLVNEDLSQPYPISNVFRSPSNTSDYNKAIELYQNKNYVQASLYFEKARKSQQDGSTATFYNGLSSLYSGHYKRAISLLTSRELTVSRYAQQAQWYLCLAYLKSDQEKKGIEILNRIKNAPHQYKHESAIQLLDALE